MRVFESLNCILCERPFARLPNQSQSPRPLSCGLAMCSECFEEEKELRKEERKHQCQLRYCFDNLNVAYFLIDVLSQEDALVITPMGYVLLKPFKVPKCVICHDEFSNKIEAKKSFSLGCGHIICTDCYLKSRTKTSFDDHKISCQICHKITCLTVDKRKDRFHDFLNELPEMTRQMEGIEMTRPTKCQSVKDESSCYECHKKVIIDEMFYCGKCNFEICAVCAYKRHHSHEAVFLLEKQSNQMLMGLQQETSNVIEMCKNLVPELHKGLLEGINTFESKLLLREENLTDASTMADLQEKHKSLTKINSKFASATEKYLSHLDIFDAEVKELIQTLDDTSVFKKPKMFTEFRR